MADGDSTISPEFVNRQADLEWVLVETPDDETPKGDDAPPVADPPRPQQ